MIDSFYGTTGMPVGIIIDQLGTYLVLSTIGIFTICTYSQASVSRPEMIRRIITFPPLIALVAAVTLMPFDYPALMTSVLSRLGNTLAPLALVSVGLQLNLAAMRGNGALMAMGLCYKLVMAPILIALVYVGLIGLHGQTTKITLFESAMAPQIGGAIVAIQYGLNAQLISLMVGIGTLLSFVTLPLWWQAFTLAF
jgi:predicted permease